MAYDTVSHPDDCRRDGLQCQVEKDMPERQPFTALDHNFSFLILSKSTAFGRGRLLLHLISDRTSSQEIPGLPTIVALFSSEEQSDFNSIR